MQGNSLLEEFEGIKLFDEKLIASIDPDIENRIHSLKERQSSLQREYFELHSNNMLSSSKQLALKQEMKVISAALKKMNSLTRPIFATPGLIDFFNEALHKATKLKSLHKEFFATTGKMKKDELKQQIGKLEWERIEATLKEEGKSTELKKINEFKKANIKPFFLWKLHFADVFQEKGGFDVVIANPPYGANIDKDLKFLHSLYSDVIQNYADIYKMFFKRGVGLLKPSAIQAFITPNTFLSQPRYKDLRKYLLNYEVIGFVNLGEGVFEQAIVPVCLSFIKNNASSEYYKYADLSELSKFSGELNNVPFQTIQVANAYSFKDYSLHNYSELKTGQVYFEQALEIKDAGIQYHRSGIGLKNKGGNDLYERLFTNSPHTFQRYSKTWYGKLIDRYYICPDSDEFFNLDYHNILKSNESVSFSKVAFDKNPKIIWRQTASQLRSALDDRNLWFRNTIQCAYIKPEYDNDLDIKYLLGVINSKYLAFLYNKLVKEAGRVFPQVKITHVKKLPLVIASKEIQGGMAKLVEEIIDAKRCDPTANTSKLEIQINQMVYDLYGLTENEIKIVEGWNDKAC